MKMQTSLRQMSTIVRKAERIAAESSCMSRVLYRVNAVPMVWHPAWHDVVQTHFL